MKTTKIISTMCAVLIALVMSACGETSQSSTESKAEAETTTTTAPAADTESETTTTTVVNDESEAETTTTTQKAEEEKKVVKTGFNESTNIIAKNGGLIYHIPYYFQKNDDNGAINCTYNEYGGSKISMFFDYIKYGDSVKLNDEGAQQIFNTLKEKIQIDNEFSSTKISHNTLLGRTRYEIAYTKTDNIQNYTSQVYMFLLDNNETNTANIGIMVFALMNDTKHNFDYIKDADSVISSLEIDKDFVYEKPAETKKDDNSKSEEKKTSEETYENNSYYDVVETASWTDMLGSTHIIHKVKAKQDVSISATMLAYSESGSVIGKGSSDIVLTKGQTNYFSYFFDEDVSNAQFKPSFKTKDNSYMLGERNGVELVEYSITGDNLYLTLKQTIDELGAFAKFKILLYNGNQIIGTEEGYFSIKAENLDGKDSTDVAEVWTYGKTYDRIEFIYEP